MDKYIDKATLFILCAVFYAQYRLDLYIIVPIICVVILSAFMSYVDGDRLRGLAALVYFAACIPRPVFVFFLPVICYDLFYTKYQLGLVLILGPAAIAFRTLPPMTAVTIVLIVGLSYLMRRRTDALEKTQSGYIALRDSTKEFSLRLENKNKELMEKQDYEIRLATLNERNRIARDIHDSVGHTLSNAILQTGALLATCRDDALRERLGVLRDTLTSGMDSVRVSVHDLYDESVDLTAELGRLADGFDFCPITLDFDMDSNPDKKVKYTLLTVVKEALSNVIRHSDASEVSVTLREHPALYQLIVRDNGAPKAPGGDGIGLKNIAQRVESVGGHVNIGYDGGFTVFVSIPKTR
ncbi:Signal transduction histidine kinase [Sporobacter termitidis DSM 10068]|uniref:histidine kinase n=1 Tax=Sporobacter termitidis DSM 10068 TaxID=1123282 RepID=A0A1M5Z9W1_9FIRM|nr:histidine kinase [Sporobacter termitidis]SHI21007.1 Signal transduction histidine kinase [Sporobacter termitidis DSM 10068]